jgi:hypothetical protein
MMERTDIEAKGGDLTIMTTMAPAAKYSQGTKTATTKGTTAEA